MLLSVLSGITESITNAIGDYGLYAVFFLMLVDAVFPAASELVMVYGGALASGAIAGQAVTLFGHTFAPGFPAYLAIALAGTIGYTIGALLGWEIGRRGGRPYLERHGRWLHLDAAKLDRAEAWFERWGDWAVLLGRVTPVVRSFISIPAGIFRVPLGRYTVLTLIGSALWCFAFAGVGWAAGASWESFHSAFRYADVAVAAFVVAVARMALASAVRRGKPGSGRRGDARFPAHGGGRPHWLGTLGRRDSACRRQGAVRAADPRAEGALRRGARVGPLHLRPRGRGVRARVGRLPRRPARDRRRERHRCPRALARGDGHRRGRRGDLPVVHVLRDVRRRSPASARRPCSPTSIPSRSTSTPRTWPRGSRRGRRRSCPCTCSAAPAALAELAALGLPLIEDAAQAFGAAGVASAGVCSTFSFFPTKNLFALGDGGLVACRDDEVAERVRMLRFHGSRDKKTFELVGTNSRLDAIQAAALRVFLAPAGGLE